MKFMKENTKCYWDQKYQQQIITIPIRTIVNPCLDVFTVKDVQYIPRGVCNRNQKLQALHRNPICVTEYYHEYIPGHFLRSDKIEYERNIHVEYDVD